MNLNEAAELLRSNHNPYTNSQAVNFLADTMLSWLDPTPISENWLLENGWVESWKFFYRDNYSIKRTYGSDWVLTGSTRYVSTLGELRMLLRLMGGEE